MTPVISVRNLTKDFRDVRAVDNLSFAVPVGEIYGFLGQNGAGKSTTIRMLLTLIRPSSGEIELFGLNLQQHRREILRQVGAIIERPDLYKYLTALENLRIFGAMTGVRMTEKKLMDQLEMVGLTERAHSKVKTYSQGMKQRLGIATALVHDPQLIILDEPTNGLDPQGIADIRNLILHLSRDLKKTLLVSSHLLSEMELIADSMLIIDKGKKLVEGRASELFDPAQTLVELKTTDNEATLEKLKHTALQKMIYRAQHGAIWLKLHRNEIPVVMKELVQMDISIVSFAARNSLEEYFLSLTAGQQHVEALKIELFKIFKRPRTYIAFGAVAAIVLLIQIALRFDGKSYMDLLLTNLKDSFDLTDEFKTQLLNGYLICFVILNTLLIHLPLLVALVAGDAIAGEANMGTLRLSLSRPVSRTEYMLVKFFASVIYTLALLIWMAILALFGSILIFGVNDMVVLRSEGIEQIPVFDVLWRYAAAFGYASIALTTVAALAFLLSVFAENSIGPIIATMSIVVAFTILSEMNIPIYDNTVKPYLFTSHMVAWKGFFYVRADAEGVTIPGSIENAPAIFRSLGILVIYTVAFVVAAVAVFRRKDILS